MVHNPTTGDLYQEDQCDSCGRDDCHEKFHLIAKRKWNSGGKGNVRLHFFESLPCKFANLFEPEAGRVTALRDAIKMPRCCLEGKCTTFEDGTTCCTRQSESQFGNKKVLCCSDLTARFFFKADAIKLICNEGGVVFRNDDPSSRVLWCLAKIAAQMADGRFLRGF